MARERGPCPQSHPSEERPVPPRPLPYRTNDIPRPVGLAHVVVLPLQLKSIERQALRVTELADPSPEELTTIRLKDLGVKLKDPNASSED